MDRRPSLTLAEQVAAAQEWWREAGVDSDFADAPRNWLEQPEKPAPEPEPEPTRAAGEQARPVIPPLGGDPATWPQTFAEFAPWWLASDALETAGTAPRIAPRGSVEAELMVLVPMPEASDSDRLLSGPHGRLIANMLRAMGVAEESALLAAALPRHAHHPDWRALAEREFGKVLLHLVNLAAPKRLLVLGRAMLPLFGHGSAQPGQKPLPIELQGGAVPALVSFGPENLLETPRFRKSLWQGWLDWTGGGQ
jgi:DNA polymerase